jgi:CubicO group peptidase (beta-lactamase class C family)
LVTRRHFAAGALASVARPALGEPQALRAHIARLVAETEIPGLAAGAAHRGRISFAEGFGFADLASRRTVTPETMFHIASVTKTIVAAGVMQLAAKGRLQLDAPVGAYLDFPVVHPRHPGRPITVRQLLTHTSGISDAHYYQVDFRRQGADATQPLGDFLRAYLTPRGAHYVPEGCYGAAPGSRWDYSNVGYALLGYAAGRIAGRDFRAQIRQSIFAPLGMWRTSWTLRDTPADLAATPYERVGAALNPVRPVGLPDWPAGMLRASIIDVTRFAAAAANGGGSILQPRWQSAMLAMEHPPGLPTWLTGQGVGWQESLLAGAARPNHWGGDPGVFAVAYLDPARRAAAVVLVNTDAAEPVKIAVKEIAAALLASTGNPEASASFG